MINNERLKSIAHTLCDIIEEFCGQAYNSKELVAERCRLTDTEYNELFTHEREEEADIVLEFSELISYTKNEIVIDKQVFDDFVRGSYIYIKFSDIEDDTVYQYIMVSEDDESITLKLFD